MDTRLFVLLCLVGIALNRPDAWASGDPVPFLADWKADMADNEMSFSELVPLDGEHTFEKPATVSPFAQNPAEVLKPVKNLEETYSEQRSNTAPSAVRDDGRPFQMENVQLT
ncbi:hypothetical protein AGOR_G00173620 [Albula goreensis]|uniref:Uncharacterized protein n=1 Tax=Albula goreensis TaxID=1534307 RepID=A0A8T3CU97_9TELE|nr:hypothetical protein AGOR_G00173620 [Albula goreensis]